MSRFRTVDVMMFALAATFLLLLIGGGVLLFRERASQQAAQQSAELIIDRLAAREIPTDFVSLHALYDQRTSVDDTATWTRILAVIKSAEFSELLRKAHGNGTTPKNEPERLAQLNVQRELLQKFAATIGEIHALAANRKAVRFDVNFEAFDYAPIDQTRQLARLFQCESNVAIADRDSSRLRQSVQTQLNLIRVFGGSDLIIDHLIRAAVDSVILFNVRSALESNVLSADDLTFVLNELKSLPPSKQSWPQIVQTERAFMLPFLTGNSVDSSDSSQGIERVSQANGKDLLNFLNFMDRFEKVNWTNWKTAKAELETISDDFDSNFSNASFWERRNWQMTSMSLAAWSMVGEILAHSDCNRNQTILGCALRLYHIQHGQFPEKLESLNDVGIDPSKHLSLADLPFGYQVQNGTAYLWGPLQDGDLHWSLQIEPSVPQADAKMTADEVERIKNSTITLAP